METSSQRLFVQHLKSNGTTASDTAVAICSSPQSRSLAALLPDGAGGAFVVWVDGRNGDDDVYAQRIDSSLAPQWLAGGLAVCALAGSAQERASAALDDSGGLFVAWDDTRSGNRDIDLQRITGAGTLAAAWPANGIAVTNSPGVEFGPALLPDGAGGVFLAWNLSTTTACALFLTRIDGTGQTVSGWTAGGMSPACPLGTPGKVVLVPGEAGGVRVLWSYMSGPGTLGAIRMQGITAGGSLAPGWPVDGVTLASGPGLRVEQATTVLDGSTFALISSGFGGAGSFHYALGLEHRGSGGTVPVLASLASVDVGTNSIRMRWFTEGLAAPVILERDAGDGAWSPLGSLTDEGGGYRTYEDRDVRPGGRYGYRLAWNEDGTAEHGAPAYFDVPLVESLRLEGAVPNPASGRVRVAFALAPASARATLELFDVTGRRVWTRRVEGLGAGRHTVTVEPALAPGVYRLRLTQGAETREAPVAIVR